MKKFHRVYVDGDILLYEVAFATQVQTYIIYVDGIEAYKGHDKRHINKLFKDIDYSYEKYIYVQPLMSAIGTYKARLDHYAELFGTNRIDVVLTGPNNFRDEVAVTRPYKGTRDQAKPYNWQDLRDYMIAHGAIVTDGEEADDYLSYMTYNNYDTVNVTIDKDADNTPSYIYNPTKKELKYVDEQDADKAFFIQMLTGDSVDNIPGLLGIGKAKATRVLEGCTTYKEYECAVGCAYASHKDVLDPEAYYTEQGLLLWMRREPNEEWGIGYA